MPRGRPPKKTPETGADAGQPPAPAKEKESKQASLKRLAEKRVPKAVHAIQVCGNLGAYKPTEAQANAILAVLVSAVNACKAALTRSGGKGEQFSLPFTE
jgi:ribosomal protein L32